VVLHTSRLGIASDNAQEESQTSNLLHALHAPRPLLERASGLPWSAAACLRVPVCIAIRLARPTIGSSAAAIGLNTLRLAGYTLQNVEVQL